MAGHENSAVRPKAAQDTLQIAAGSPLAIQGIFLEILRERFRSDANVGRVWRPDLTETDIVIEAAYNDELEARNAAPALYVTRTQTVPAKIVLGDRAGVRLPDHKEGFGALASVNIQVECVSNDEGESALLGDMVQFMLLASQDVIQREFGFYDMSHPSLGQTVPFSRDQNKWTSPVDFYVQFWIRWAQVPIAPLLQQISQRMSRAGATSDYFSEVTMTSLRRADTASTALSPVSTAPITYIPVTVQGETPGTLPRHIGSIYLDANTVVTAESVALLGNTAEGTTVVRMLRLDGNDVLAIWSGTGSTSSATLQTDVHIHTAGWYLFDLASATEGTVAHCYGIRLAVR